MMKRDCNEIDVSKFASTRLKSYIQSLINERQRKLSLFGISRFLLTRKELYVKHCTVTFSLVFETRSSDDDVNIKNGFNYLFIFYILFLLKGIRDLYCFLFKKVSCKHENSMTNFKLFDHK